MKQTSFKIYHSWSYASQRLQNDEIFMMECPKVDGLILFDTVETFIQDEEMMDIAIKSIQKDVLKAIRKRRQRKYWLSLV